MPRKLTLVLGAELGRMDAGIIEDGKWVACESRNGNPVEGLGPLLSEVFREHNFHPLDAQEWIYSGGPGSLLALRSLCMILETWAALNNGAPVKKKRFSGMVWTARQIERTGLGGKFTLISPWRAGAWNLLEAGHDRPPHEADLAVLEGSCPDADSLYLLGSRSGSNPAAAAKPVGLPPFASLLEDLADKTFLQPTPRAEPIQTGTTTYRTWEGRPHSAP